MVRDCPGYGRVTWDELCKLHIEKILEWGEGRRDGADETFGQLYDQIKQTRDLASVWPAGTSLPCICASSFWAQLELRDADGLATEFGFDKKKMSKDVPERGRRLFREIIKEEAYDERSHVRHILSLKKFQHKKVKKKIDTITEEDRNCFENYYFGSQILDRLSFAKSPRRYAELFERQRLVELCDDVTKLVKKTETTGTYLLKAAEEILVAAIDSLPPTKDPSAAPPGALFRAGPRPESDPSLRLWSDGRILALEGSDSCADDQPTEKRRPKFTRRELIAESCDPLHRMVHDLEAPTNELPLGTSFATNREHQAALSNGAGGVRSGLNPSLISDAL